MKSHRLTVVNFCKYRGMRCFDFTDGLTGILGPNGIGKSNMLGAIRFAYTGENPNIGTKAANICNKAPTTEVSYVELIFSHGSVTATVRRNLRPAKPTAILTIEGGETIEGDQEVTRRIEQILGIGVDIINDIVIVGQEEIFGFLDKTPAKRAEQFQRLFRTEKSAVIYKTINDQLKTVEIPAVGVNRDELVTSINAAVTAASSLTVQLTQTVSYQMLQQQRDQDGLVLRHYDAKYRLCGQIDSIFSQLNQLGTQRTQASIELTNAQNDHATISAASQGNKELANAARVKLATIAQSRQQQVARTATETNLNRVTAEITRVEALPPLRPANYVPDYMAASKTRQELHTQIINAKQFLSSFKDGVAECPTCQTPTTQLAGKITETAMKLPSMQKWMVELETNVTQSMDYDKALEQHTNTLTNLKREADLLRNHLNTMPNTTVEEVDEQALNKVLLDERTFAEGLAEYNQTISRLTSAIARYDGQISTLQLQLTQLQTESAATPDYTPEQVKAAQQDMTACDVASANRRQAESQLAIEQTRAQQLQNQLASTDEIVKRATMARAWHEFAGRIGAVFHKDAAPRFVAQRNLQRLQHSMNDVLEQFDTDFRVTADEGLSFIVHFNEGTIQPAERLSGGQKVVLALSFRLALCLMFGDIGALYLDEPTAWLDEHHIRGFEPVLQQLRDFSTSRGLQSILITHEQSLAPLFDTVIQL